MAKKQVEHYGFWEQLTYLFLSDDRTRWKFALVTIAVGVVVGAVKLGSGDRSLEDANAATNIVMAVIAVLLLGVYSLSSRRTSAEEAPRLRIPLRIAATTCGLAIVFGGFSYTYQTNTLKTQFSKAIETHDYTRIAYVTNQASTVSNRLRTALLQKTGQEFLDATQQPSSWNAVLISLRTLPTSLQTNQWTFTPMEHAILAFPNVTTIGGNFNVSAVTGDAVELGKVTAKNRPLAPPLFDGTVFQGGRQTLDGFEWRNVTFVGMQISYKGGVVKLEGVRFVNCTFDLPPDPRGAKLAQYVALGLPKLEFGSAAS